MKIGLEFVVTTLPIIIEFGQTIEVSGLLSGRELYSCAYHSSHLVITFHAYRIYLLMVLKLKVVCE